MVASYLLAENTVNTYRVNPDGSLRVNFASGMEISLNEEPHILAGVFSPTLGKCNISLPGEHSPNLIEWRQRKEQNKGNISSFERRLRVRLFECHITPSYNKLQCFFYAHTLWEDPICFMFCNCRAEIIQWFYVALWTDMEDVKEKRFSAKYSFIFLCISLCA